MSRSGYNEDCENLNLYRGNVERVLRSKRGQAFLRELAAQMDAMPEKILIEGELVAPDGQCCTMGVVCKARGIETEGIDYEDPGSVAKALGINYMMAAEIAYENDECGPPSWSKGHDETPAERWERMRKWVQTNLHSAI